MSSDNTTVALEDIRALAKNTISIAHTFRASHEGMCEVVGLVNNHPLISTEGQTRAKNLAEEWSKHGKAFTDLLWETKTIAGRAEAAVQDFTQSIVSYLKNIEHSFKDKQTELHNYAEQLVKDEKPAAETSQRFSNLKDDVKGTCDAWRSLAQSFKKTLEASDKELTGKIQDLDGQLKYFSERFESQSKKIAELGNGPNAGSYYLGTWSPWYRNDLNEHRAKRLEAEKERATTIEKRTEIDLKLRAAIKERDEYRQTYQQLSEKLAKVDAEFDVVIAKNMMLSRIWAVLRSEIQRFQTKLELASQAKTPELREIRLGSSEHPYKKLIEALREYQLCVSEDDLKKD